MQRPLNNAFLVFSLVIAISAVFLVNNLEQQNFAGEAFTNPQLDRLDQLPAGVQAQTQALRARNTPNLPQVAQERKQEMLRLAEEDPQAFLDNALSDSERRGLPRNAQKHVEQRVQTTGYLNAEYIDNFEEPEKSRIRHTVANENANLELKNTGSVRARPGTNVQVEGYQLEESLILSSEPVDYDSDEPDSRRIDEIPEPDLPAGEPSSFGQQNFLVVPIRYRDSAPKGITKQMLRDAFEDSGAINDWIEEVSYGQATMDITVMDWTTLPASQYDTEGKCRNWNGARIIKYLDDQGFDVRSYNRFYFPVALNYDCNPGWAGLASIGPVSIFLSDGTVHRATYGFTDTHYWDFSTDERLRLDMGLFQHITLHELGHNFGSSHNSRWACDIEGHPLNSPTCKHYEYAAAFDVLGSLQAKSTHFSVPTMELVGWLEPRTITRTGTYTLDPLEEDSGTRGAKIVTNNMEEGEALYLEYRQPIGVDAGLGARLTQNTKGVLGYYRFEEHPYNSHILNLHDDPYLGGFAINALTLPSLTDNPVFTDTTRGFSIGPVHSATEDRVRFDVNFPVDLYFTSYKDYYGNTRLRWNADQARDCEARWGWSGTKASSGNELVSPKSTTTYVLHCRAGPFADVKSVTVEVDSTSSGDGPRIAPTLR